MPSKIRGGTKDKHLADMHIPRVSALGAGGGAAAVAYTLYDAFTTDRAAGAVNGTTSESPYATGGGVTRTVTDTASKLTIASGALTFAATANAAGDPGLWYASQARAAGKTLIGSVTLPATATRVDFGWDASAAGTILDALRFGATTVLSAVANGTAVVVGAYAAETYQVALVMRGTGMWYFIKGGAFTNWTLLWTSGVVNAAGLPGVVAETTASLAFTADNIRIPVATYIPSPLAYDTFTRSNGALGSTETTGPDSQAVAAKTWLFTSGVWAVSSNAAVGTPATLGSDLIVNGDFASDTVWSKAAGWTIAGGVGVATTAADGRTISQAVFTAGTWYTMTYTISGYSVGGLRTVQTGPNRTANGTYTETVLAANTTAGLTTVGTTTLNIDNVSAQALTTAELFSSVTVSTPNVIADVNVTRTLGYQTGLVLNLDSDTNPQNFVIAQLLGVGSNTNAQLIKVVAGTPTTIINANVTYSAGAQLRVIKDGTSYSLYYNGAIVGSTSTISDAGIVDNTLHGLFSTSALNSLDGFTLWARGVSNEYATLDTY